MNTLQRVATLIVATIILPIGSAYAQPNLDVDSARIANADAESGNWLAHGRTYDEQRFSPLEKINEGNVSDLGLAWSTPTQMGRGHEASPIVVDGTMYITLPWSKVMALNAKTGERLWDYDPQVPPEWARNACCDVVNRGVAIWKGSIYFGTLDGRLVALDAKTGELQWETMTIDPDRPYTITGAPRIIKDKVIIGNGGADLGVRGYFSAYNAKTGEQEWRFYTVPGNPEYPFEHPELEAAAQTWTGKWWEIGGGGTAWDSMAYDPDLNLLYVGTGNGSPWNRSLRSPDGGDNLYLSSILALNPDTGRLKWHYQVTPADNWDYTATQHIILADMEIEGKDRKVLMQAPKNGFFYVLDRDTGELLSADNYVDVTWASHVDLETGRPVETDGDYTSEPKLVYPSPTGGHNWHPMSYSPQTGLVYIPARKEPFLFINDTNFKYRKWSWNTGLDFSTMIAIAKTQPPPEVYGILLAWDPVKKKEAWSIRQDTTANGGILSTAGNLVFQGTGGGIFAAYTADTGKKLWEDNTHIGMVAPPVTYTVDGEQYIAVLAGWGGVPPIIGADFATAATTTHINEGHMLAYKLGGKAPAPAVTPRRYTLIPAPPEDDASVEVINKGERLFHQNCSQCHGLMAITSGVVADLRYSSKAVHQSYGKIVLDGVMEKSGMASFSNELNKEEVAAIHSYVISRAREDRAAQLKAGLQ
ncbi:MAG: PQQ-dependent dehydrogenase, methanol/ethanol family [Candidatus Hydrogenedentota bacterium]|nr:MAG: PQQ-dependent dehydrogenase, methanol/ethanol family [Candidatus Hydrogenedentota bacterium]